MLTHKVLWTIVGSYFFSKNAHSLVRRIAHISLISVTLSVMAAVLVLSIMKALNHRVQQRLLQAEPHLVIALGDQQKDVDALESMLATPRVLKRFAVTRFDLIVRTWQGRFFGVVALGYSASDLQWLFHQYQQQNVAVPSNYGLNESLGPGQVWLGADVMENLGIFAGASLLAIPPQALIEDQIRALNRHSLEVAGGIRSHSPDLDGSVLYFDLDQNTKFFPELQQQGKQYQVWLQDPFQSTEIKLNLEKAGWSQVETWQERNSATFFALKLERTLIVVCLSLAMIVATFALVMAVVLLISHKSHELRILRILGLPPSGLKRLIQGLTAGFGALGLIMGLSLGVLAALWLQFFPLNILPEIYYDSAIQAEVDWVLVGVILVSGLAFLWWLSARLYHEQSKLPLNPNPVVFR